MVENPKGDTDEVDQLAKSQEPMNNNDFEVISYSFAREDEVRELI